MNGAGRSQALPLFCTIPAPLLLATLAGRRPRAASVQDELELHISLPRQLRSRARTARPPPGRPAGLDTYHLQDGGQCLKGRGCALSLIRRAACDLHESLAIRVEVLQASEAHERPSTGRVREVLSPLAIRSAPPLRHQKPQCVLDMAVRKTERDTHEGA